MEEIDFATDVSAGIEGHLSKFAAFLPHADIPAPLRKGAPEALGGKFDIPRNCRYPG